MKLRQLTISALFLALALILPMLFGQIPQIGIMLLPMHLPIFICAMICDKKYAMLIGFLAPILKSTLFLMPPLFPSGIAMAFELMTYGFIFGLIYERSNKNSIISLLIAMICGRLMWGVINFLLLGANFSLEAFLSGAVLSSIPGIILQLILIPIIATFIKNITGGKYVF